MNGFIVNIKLRQHTPMLHFQHSEEGATLRASDLRPKLDRFIIEKAGKGNYENVKSQVKKDYKNWFIDKNDVFALNYKIRIEAKDKDPNISLKDMGKKTVKNKKNGKDEIYYLIENYPLLLSNMGGKQDKNELVNFSFYENISVCFIVWDITLRDMIRDNINEFFLKNNFGQRNDKGFGSFSVITVPECYDTYFANNTPYISYTIKGNIGLNEYKQLFTTIDYYWKRLKSGINYTERKFKEGKATRTNKKDNNNLYYKSYLYEYLGKKGLTWEKRRIKQNLSLESTPMDDDPPIYPDNKQSFFARAHLGCPGNMIYRVAKTQKEKGKLYDKINTYVITIKNNDIARIPSPIIFKPIITKKDDHTEIKIYLLLDKNVISKLKSMHDNPRFTFKYSYKDKYEEKHTNFTDINLFTTKDGKKFTFDYYDLIRSFHEHEKKKLDIMNNEKIIINNVTLS